MQVKKSTSGKKGMYNMRSRMEHEQGMSCCRWQTPPLSDIFKFLICQSVVIQSKGWRKRERMWEILLFCWESSKCFLVSFVSGAGTGHLILQWAVQSSDHCCAVNVSWSVQCLGENTCRWVKKKSVCDCLSCKSLIHQSDKQSGPRTPTEPEMGNNTPFWT